MTLGDKTLDLFANLQVWQRNGERAPNKPLLVLYALGRIQQGKQRLQPYTEVESELRKLLEDFGPPRNAVHPEYPFWRLQTDGIWEVQCPEEMKKPGAGKDPLVSELRRTAPPGGFTEPIYRRLQKRPEILRSVANSVLESHFPTTLHESIANAVGLNLDIMKRNSPRDAAFRHEVISAWGHKCGFCGYDLKLENTHLGLEAAHIRWVQAGGPDILANGITCCSLHHLALDRGAIGIDDNLRIIVSSRLHGSTFLNELFLALHGKHLRLPARKVAFPKQEYIHWHRKQVFAGEPRD